jgi:phosphatidylglycerophosphatase A
MAALSLTPHTYSYKIRGMKPVPARFMLSPVHALALGFGAGYMPKMPGTAGTLAGVVLYLPLQFLPWPWYLGVVALLFLTGLAICGAAAAALEVHDHPAIVWDEITGFLLTMALAPRGWVWILVGFVLFRFFDIAKPWPIKQADRAVGGGLGIMLDDVLAAVYGWIFLHIIHILYLVSTNS